MNYGLVACCALSFAVTSMGQGSLTPPGPPAPTMKTLGQIDQSIVGVSNAVKEVEARIPISEAGYVITQPGSYYLTTNLYAHSDQAGITIDAEGVTLDLNGFTIEGSGSSLNGIEGFWDMHVFNGTVRNFGKHGISGGGMFRNLRLCFNGNNYDPHGENQYFGMSVEGIVEDCFFIENGNGLEIHGGRATGNVISSYGGMSGIGIRVYNGCHVSDNTVTGFSVGYDIGYAEGSFVVKNSAIDCDIGFEINSPESTNGVGTVRTSPVGAGPWDNFDINSGGWMQ